MKRVLKVIIPVVLIAALAALFVGPWAAGPRGIPAGVQIMQDDEEIGRLKGQIAHIVSVTRPSWTRSRRDWDSVDASFDKCGRCTRVVRSGTQSGISVSRSEAYDYSRRGELTGLRVVVTGLYESRSQYLYHPGRRQIVERVYNRYHDNPRPVGSWLDKIKHFFRGRNPETYFGSSIDKLDSHGRVVESASYGADGTFHSGYKVKRDSRGRVVEMTSDTPTLSSRGGAHTVYVRDGRGNVIYEKEDWLGGMAASFELRRSYEYDRKGNWTRMRESRYYKGKWKPDQLTERQITDYK